MFTAVFFVTVSAKAGFKGGIARISGTYTRICDGFPFALRYSLMRVRMKLSLCAMLLFFCSGLCVAEEQKRDCSEVLTQIKSAAKYVGADNYAFQLKRGSGVYYILFLQKASSGTQKLRWRMIERIGESVNYCVLGQGEDFAPLQDMHLSNPSGKYGLPGSGYPRCAGNLESGLPGSLDIRMWVNRELGDSTIYDLPNIAGARSFVFLTSSDNAGAWVILDYAPGNLSDTCYYARGDSSDIHEDVKGK